MEIPRGVERFRAEHIHYGFLIGRQRIGEHLPFEVGGFTVGGHSGGMVKQCGLESAEAEIETVLRGSGFAGGSGKRTREMIFLRIAALGQTLDDGSAGIAQVQQFGAFVQCFARGVVDRGAGYPGFAVGIRGYIRGL